jgi:hypothetical protein
MRRKLERDEFEKKYKRWAIVSQITVK